jgi:hypothetical protein
MPKLDQPQKEDKKDKEKADTSVQKEKELREEEKVPFILAYRDNELFQKYVPVIEDFLKEQGYPVSIQSFPAGTPPEEIKKWFDEHKSEFEGKFLLSDRTFNNSSLWWHGKEIVKDSIGLDNILYTTTRNAVLGYECYNEEVEDVIDQNLANRIRELSYKDASLNKDELDKLEDELEIKSLSVEREIYKKILNNIPEEEKQKEFVILKGGPFDGEGYFFPPVMVHSPYLSQDKQKLIDQINRYTFMLEQCLKEAGITNVHSFNTGAEIPSEIMEKLKKKEAYIIADRHGRLFFKEGINLYLNRSYNKERSFWGPHFREAAGIKFDDICLATPIANFYNDALKKLHFQPQVEPKQMEESIKKLLHNEIQKRLERMKEEKEEEGIRK